MSGIENLIQYGAQRELFMSSVRAMAYNHKRLFGMENVLISRVIQITELVILDEVEHVCVRKDTDELWKQFFFVLRSIFEQMYV